MYMYFAGSGEDSSRLLAIVVLPDPSLPISATVNILPPGWAQIDPVARPELAGRVLEARAALRQRLDQDPELSRMVEPFDAEAFCDALFAEWQEAEVE